MDFERIKPVVIKFMFFIGIIFLVIIYKKFNPNQYFFPRCPVYSLTGLYCPGCGSQRSLHAFLNLNIGDAFSSNLLVGFLIVILIVELLFYILKLEKFRPVNFMKSNRYFSIIVLCVVIAFTLLRNIPVFPFNVLAP
jgi:hypothetical protein